MIDLEKVLTDSVLKKASDVHISPENPISFRVFGDILPQGIVVNDQEVQNMVLSHLTEKQQENLEKNRHVDFVYTTQSKNRFRGNAYYTRKGLSLAFRTIPVSIPAFTDLGLPMFVLEEISKLKHGLVLVVGPTGHGKSTTLASILDYRAANFQDHIIMMEDPVEFIINSQKGIVDQRSVGRDVNSFYEGLTAALREDPDVLMVGEMRDLETISAALTAAETGHLVLATLHTNDAAETINRIIDVFPADQQAQIRTQLTSTLTMVIAQKLIPTIDKQSRALAYEVLVTNYAIKNHIRQNTVYQIQNAMQTDATGKMILFDQSLAGLVLQKKVSHSLALEYAHSEEGLNHILQLNGWSVA